MANKKCNNTNSITPFGKAHGPQEWQKLVDAKDFSQKALVYEVRATDAQGNPVTVSYGGIDDPTGMIYIGEQGDNTNRVNELLEGFKTKGLKDNHGTPTKFFNEGLDQTYPVDQLEIRVTLIDQSQSADSPYSGLFDKPAEKGKVSDAKVAARVNERGLISSFIKKHKRRPPLNKQKGFHTKTKPLKLSPGEKVPDDDPIVMESIADKQLQKAKADAEAKKNRGN